MPLCCGRTTPGGSPRTSCTRRSTALIEEFLDTARRNIFMTESTFVNLTRSEGTLAEKLRAGLDIRLLLWDACNEAEIAGLIEHQGTSRKKIENEIKVALALLVPMQKSSLIWKFASTRRST